MRTIHIACTGGGTGGHIFPILAVADGFAALAAEKGLRFKLSYIGPTRGPVDVDVASFRERGISVRSIGGRWTMPRPLTLAVGFFQSIWHLYFAMPDIIFSKGGYGASPVIAAALWYRIPIFVHESDTIPGRANLFAARFATRIAVAFLQAASYFPAEKTAVTGNPIRRIFTSLPARDAAHASLKLSPARKTVLIIGGSQGAKALNDITLDVLPELLKRYQILHQCGARNFGEIKKESDFVRKGLPQDQADGYRLYGFFGAEELANAYAASDLVVSRAGAGSIFEIASAGAPAIMIPLSHAAQDHQRANAYAYAETGAAAVLEEANLTPHIFVSQIGKILDDEAARQKMAAAAKAFAKPDAAVKIAAELLRSVGVAV